MAHRRLPNTGRVRPDSGQARASGLEKNRLFLLDFLADRFEAEAGGVLVVFDAARAPARRASEMQHRGLQVRFAKGRPEADDLIEDLLAQTTRGSKLTLVSSDRRLQKAAQRRDVRFLDCGAFLDELERRPPASSPPAPQSAPKEKEPSADTAYWLKQFRAVENEPGVDELFDRFGGDEQETKP
ncbi:MAG: NYN domain-containing protein [Gemmataceae bacterium]